VITFSKFVTWSSVTLGNLHCNLQRKAIALQVAVTQVFWLCTASHIACMAGGLVVGRGGSPFPTTGHPASLRVRLDFNPKQTAGHAGYINFTLRFKSTLCNKWQQPAMALVYGHFINRAYGVGNKYTSLKTLLIYSQAIEDAKLHVNNFVKLRLYIIR